MLKQRMHSLTCSATLDKGAMGALTAPGAMFSQQGGLPNATFQVANFPSATPITPLMKATAMVAHEAMVKNSGGAAKMLVGPQNALSGAGAVETD